ncbi:RHS repeat protein [Paraflavitalea pollutisoli]|uniref:RHS repeat protein n=1 Tax=Paraflavitalea pollutisoli TaxID=3034143 RepID=UPI0023EB1E68|nr:RHS repeat-associated core domain-containing protein [Paraflavitalea sp. H1-2-19X]
MDTLLQDYGRSDMRPNLMNKNGNRWKKIVYEYDLISGKVNQVKYQPKFVDQWTHRYFYDAENRLTEVQTSSDGFTWDREAKYEYYLHGPLARTTIGQEQVQGIDYAYTLQGWLKGVNSASYLHDMGGDSKDGAANQYVARDAMSFSLNYFDGEYKPIAPGVTPFPSYRGAGTPMPDSAYRPLYNGNISSALYNIRKFELNNQSPFFYNYRYDQLNRYVGQDKYANFDVATNSYGAWGYGPSFRERVSYDANGNIQRYLRHSLSDLDYWPMDSLSYKYYAGTNQLQRVIDNVPKDRFGSQTYDKVYDIDNQDSVFNYKYDSIGNLIEDKSEKITSIKWNVYGKITEIKRNPSITDQNTTFWTKYRYDVQGNRIAKMYLWYDKEDRPYINLPPGYQLNFTWYVRDAQGNLLTTYSTTSRDTTTKDSLSRLLLQQEDIHLYGSSRLGMFRPDSRNIDDTTSNSKGPGLLFPYYGTVHYRGAKQYELANHLGNVLTTISDRRIHVYSGATLPADPTIPLVAYYEAEKLAAYDYYPFGMVARMNDNSGKYRFGFNGKENDNEVKGGIGSQQDYGFRVYDPRIGKFLSVDPLTKSYPELTPYQFASNSPIAGVDLDGLEFSLKTLAKIKKAGEALLGATKATSKAFLHGTSNGVANANSFGLTDHAPEWSGLNTNNLNSYSGTEKVTYLVGRAFGAMLVIDQAGSEMGVGGGMAASGVGIIGGAAVGGHGLAVGAAATYDLSWVLAQLLTLNINLTDNVGSSSTNDGTDGSASSAHNNNSGSSTSSTGSGGQKNASSIPGRVQSRINLANGTTRTTPTKLTGGLSEAGWEHVVKGHFDRALANSRSVFTISQDALKKILQSSKVVSSPVTPLKGGQFLRTVDTGEIVGNAALKQGGQPTTWLQVITDRAGNLMTTYPVRR